MPGISRNQSGRVRPTPNFYDALTDFNPDGSDGVVELANKGAGCTWHGKNDPRDRFVFDQCLE